MATIVLTTPYINGTTLNVAGHNANLYDTLAGRSIYGEPNGRLNLANLAPGFEIRADHIQPGEAIKPVWHASAVPLAIYSDAFPSLDEGRDFVQIADWGVRLHLPASVTEIEWLYQAYIHAYRSKFVNAAAQVEDPAAIIKAFVDGVAIEHTRRPLPYTNVYNQSAGAPASTTTYESLGADFLTGQHTTAPAAAGFHELSVRLYMERGGALQITTEQTISGGTVTVVQYGHTRVSLGHRMAVGIPRL